MNKDLEKPPLTQTDIDRLISKNECMMAAFKEVMWEAYHMGYNEGFKEGYGECHEGWLNTI